MPGVVAWQGKAGVGQENKPTAALGRSPQPFELVSDTRRCLGIAGISGVHLVGCT